MLHLQNTILEMIARGETLEATIERLCGQIEEMLPGVCCSVLRVDRSGLLHPIASSFLLNEFSAQLDGKLNIRVVAEGIESELQASMLLEIGCELGQGFLFSQAVSRQIATELLVRFGQTVGARKGPQIPFSRAN